jgi:hypothetical protein
MSYYSLCTLGETVQILQSLHQFKCICVFINFNEIRNGSCLFALHGHCLFVEISYQTDISDIWRFD